MTDEFNGKSAKSLNATVATLLVLLLSGANLLGIPDAGKFEFDVVRGFAAFLIENSFRGFMKLPFCLFKSARSRMI